MSVIDVNGKEGIFLCHAILTALGVPCHVVFDGDNGVAERKLASIQGKVGDERARAEKKIREAADKSARLNGQLLNYLDATTKVPWPASVSQLAYTVFEDNLEEYLKGAWPTWTARLQELIATGDGFPGKNAATYREAARSTEGNPPALLIALLANVQELLRNSQPAVQYFLPLQPGPEQAAVAEGPLLSQVGGA
ncbi:hypothetical protein P3T37_004245 [Kitasatospora sp. MAA4]|nr:TOPRIM nucleotidyl transferase/hydrolase domain-containing protein [Kitasatospora sp. MAA4]MDH6134836.1 hypothetical protein [Kitasatospora sp. MAA4]